MRLRLSRTGHGTRHADALSSPAVVLAPETGQGFDIIDAPAGAGHRVLLQSERIGSPLGPVLATSDRLYFFVEAGSTASFRSDLRDLGWEPGDVDLRAREDAASAIPLPPLGNSRWVRGPETGVRAASLPPARLLLGSLAYACRRGAGRPTQASHRKAA